jgi:hypothetical protein
MAAGDSRALAGVERKSIGAQQGDAIDALLREPEVEAAAAMAGVSADTLREWLTSPQFRARYRAARQEAVDDAVARLEHLVGSAVETLARNLMCGDPAVEVEAARVVLEGVLTTADRRGTREQASARGPAPADRRSADGRSG